VAGGGNARMCTAAAWPPVVAVGAAPGWQINIGTAGV
jgi:hypothetical protein